MTRPSTLVVVHTCGAKGLDAESLQRQANLRYGATLPSPEAVVYPQGSHTEAYLYKLGRPDDELKSLKDLDSSHLRSLRASIHKARTQQGRVHVIGLLDVDSPAGSRSALESLLRQTHGLGLNFIVHPAIWHATPTEQQYGMRELQTLLNTDETELGALFDLHSDTGETLKSRFDRALPEHVRLQPEDVVVIVNHDMHGLHAFADHLADYYGVMVTALAHDVPAAPPLLDSLSRRKHVVSAVNRPSYERAYAGTVSHPYYESYYQPKATDLLGMLVSPQFQTRADHLFVGVDAEADPDFKHVLSSLLRQQSDRTLVCCLVNPHSIDASVVLANVPLDHDGSLYHHVHRALR